MHKVLTSILILAVIAVFSAVFLFNSGGEEEFPVQDMPVSDVSPASEVFPQSPETPTLQTTVTGELPEKGKPSDSNVGVSWRIEAEFDHVTPPYGQHYDALHTMAVQGDEHAAFSLFLILDACRNTFETQVDVDNAVDNLGESENTKQLAGLIQSQYDNCSPITSAQKARAEHWLQIAVDDGVPEALMLHASQVQNIEESITVLEQAWNGGDIRALEVLSQKHKENYESGAIPTDNVRAYATLYAYLRLEEDVHAAGTHDFTSSMEHSRNTLQEMAESMRENEIAEAIATADVLIRSNTNCCFIVQSR